MPAPSKQEQTLNNDAARYAAEVEELKAQNARLVKEAEEAKAAANHAEEEAKAAREEAEQAQNLLGVKRAEAEAEAARQEALIAHQLNAQRRYRIVVASGRDPHDRAPIPIGVNGREYLIVRDKEVDVPQAVLNVLDLAVEQVAEVEEVNGQRHVSFRQAKRFSYTNKGPVDPITGQLVGQ